jgi:hypothetical protein
MISTIMMYLLLFVSLIINIAAVWYVVQLIREMKVYYENFKQMNYMARDYRNHLEAVYELDMFYGDTTLSELLRHTKDFSTDIEAFVEEFPFEEMDSGE